MWCSIEVVFCMLEDFHQFITGNFGDMEVGDMSVMCYGNHRLLNDVHTWIEDSSRGDITTLENIDGYDITTVYQEGVKISETSVEEEREI